MRRLTLFVLVALLAFGLAVPSAFAWGSGGDDGNGYGTHDWVLDQAIRLVGQDASWVDVRTALLATDDPDSLPKDIGHVFHSEGLYGGVPQRVADLYYRACESYAAGDRVEASRLLGLLSHYYADILNPFHTADGAVSWRVHHLPYEHAVSMETNRPGENAAWVAPAARVPLVDVRARTVVAARFARGKLTALGTALDPMTRDPCQPADGEFRDETDAEPGRQRPGGYRVRHPECQGTGQGAGHDEAHAVETPCSPRPDDLRVRDLYRRGREADRGRRREVLVAGRGRFGRHRDRLHGADRGRPQLAQDGRDAVRGEVHGPRDGLVERIHDHEEQLVRSQPVTFVWRFSDSTITRKPSCLTELVSREALQGVAVAGAEASAPP